MNGRFYTHPRLCSGRRSVWGRLDHLAIRTQAPHTQTMMRRTEPKFVRHLVLQRLDVRREELDHPTTFSADHMVVMLVVVVVLVIGLVVAETHFACERSLGEKLERAIHGRMSDGGVFL